VAHLLPLAPLYWNQHVAFQAVDRIGTTDGSLCENCDACEQGLMPPKCVCVALVSIFALAASRSAQAQVTVDVTKVNCDQFVHHKISEPRLIAAWLSGYYNAKRNNKVIDLQTLEENMSKVKNYCSDEKNFKVPVMKAVEQVLGKSN
jgi:acid stress chaperone HdeB